MNCCWLLSWGFARSAAYIWAKPLSAARNLSVHSENSVNLDANVVVLFVVQVFLFL